MSDQREEERVILTGAEMPPTTPIVRFHRKISTLTHWENVASPCYAEKTPNNTLLTAQPQEQDHCENYFTAFV